MWSVLRSRIVSPPSKHLGFSPSLLNRSLHSSAAGELLKLDEVEKILSDVKADNVRVIRIPIGDGLLSDYMVVATGRSAWHVRNIAQALIYKVKQKQKGSARMLLPSVEGEEGGNWIVVDSGSVIVHALDEKVRSYYNLESLWATDASNGDQDKDLDQAFAKVRPKNNSKKRPKGIESRA